MFSKLLNLFGFSNEKPECFICCSDTGKTDKELEFEMLYNQKFLNYPLITMKDAFNCKCKNLYAHNRCLIKINKCPLCRKNIKPKLYVKSNYDFWLYYFFEWIKKDISRIKKIQWFSVSCLILTLPILCMLDKKIIVIEPKTTLSLIFASIYGIIYFFAIFMILLNDYFKKYWLYDEKQAYGL